MSDDGRMTYLNDTTDESGAEKTTCLDPDYDRQEKEALLMISDDETEVDYNEAEHLVNRIQTIQTQIIQLQTLESYLLYQLENTKNKGTVGQTLKRARTFIDSVNLKMDSKVTGSEFKDLETLLEIKTLPGIFEPITDPIFHGHPEPERAVAVKRDLDELQKRLESAITYSFHESRKRQKY